MEPTHEPSFRAWLHALERGAPQEELAAFFAPDVISHEHPNLLFPHGATRDQALLLAGAERGRRVVGEQRWEVLDVLCTGDQLAARLRWSGKLLIDLGARLRGTVLRCEIAAFVRYREGRISEHHSYDCYLP